MIYDLFAKIWKNNKYLHQEFQNFYPQLLIKKYKNTLEIFSSDGLNKCVAKLQKKNILFAEKIFSTYQN